MAYYTAPYAFQTTIPQGYGGQFFPSSLLSSFFYDISATILYTFYPQNQYDAWLNVPSSVAQQLSIAGKQYSSAPSYPNPDTIYNTNIKGVFPKCILTESGSPLLCDNGNYLVV
jgi:hypothetical protein